MNRKKMSYDVVVAGAGIVGATLALTLAQVGFQVLVLDHTPLVPFINDTNPDLRVLALSCSSVELLYGIKVWQRIEEGFFVPYRRLELWEWHVSKVVFDAASVNLPELGFIVENRRLQRALWEGFSDCTSLTFLCPASLKVIQYESGRWRLTLDDGSKLITRLLVGAEGPNSQVRKQAGITVGGWEYRQACLLLSVEIEGNSQDSTWQMFTPSGPRAFLPLYKKWASLAWYDSASYIRKLQELPLPALEREVGIIFPSRLGAIKLHSSGAFPLMCHHARDYVKAGVVLIGDAAHTINPLAGQGANLGFRDVMVLADVLISARKKGEAWDTLPVLSRYQHRRRADNLLMQVGMDFFYTTFSNNLFPIKLSRNIALLLAQRADGLKRRVLKYALGL